MAVADPERPRPSPGPRPVSAVEPAGNGPGRRPRPRPLPTPRPAAAAPPRQAAPAPALDDGVRDEGEPYADDADHDEYADTYGTGHDDYADTYDDGAGDEYDDADYEDPDASDGAERDLRDRPAPAGRGRFRQRRARTATRPPRRRPRLPVARMRGGLARGIARGLSGVRAGASAVRHHWGRAAYAYLAVVGIAFLITLLLYWNSGFTYDECRYCGLPVLTAVSPWWLLLMPFDAGAWPLALPLLVLLLGAGVNAELVDRWSKRPEPVYPDWD